MRDARPRASWEERAPFSDLVVEIKEAFVPGEAATQGSFHLNAEVSVDKVRVVAVAWVQAGRPLDELETVLVQIKGREMARVMDVLLKELDDVVVWFCARYT